MLVLRLDDRPCDGGPVRQLPGHAIRPHCDQVNVGVAVGYPHRDGLVDQAAVAHLEPEAGELTKCIASCSRRYLLHQSGCGHNQRLADKLTWPECVREVRSHQAIVQQESRAPAVSAGPTPPHRRRAVSYRQSSVGCPGRETAPPRRLLQQVPEPRQCHPHLRR